MFYQAYSNTLKHHNFLSALRFKVQASLFKGPNLVAFGSLFNRTSSLQFSICHGTKFGPAVSSSLTLCSLAQGFSLASAIGHSPKIVPDVREFAVQFGQFFRDDFSEAHTVL